MLQFYLYIFWIIIVCTLWHKPEFIYSTLLITINLKSRSSANAEGHCSSNKYSPVYLVHPTVATTVLFLNSHHTNAELVKEWAKVLSRITNVLSALVVLIAKVCSLWVKIPRLVFGSICASFVTGIPRRSTWRKREQRSCRITSLNCPASGKIRPGYTILPSLCLRRQIYRFRWKTKHISTLTINAQPSDHPSNNLVPRTSNSSKKSMRLWTLWSSMLGFSRILRNIPTMNKNTPKLCLFWPRRLEGVLNAPNLWLIYTSRWYRGSPPLS